MLIYDGSSVVEGISIDGKALNALARALHEEEIPRGHNDWPAGCLTPEQREQHEQSYDQEVEENGGYCNRCCDLAAFILSKFNISDRES